MNLKLTRRWNLVTCFRWVSSQTGVNRRPIFVSRAAICQRLIFFAVLVCGSVLRQKQSRYLRTWERILSKHLRLKGLIYYSSTLQAHHSPWTWHIWPRSLQVNSRVVEVLKRQAAMTGSRGTDMSELRCVWYIWGVWDILAAVQLRILAWTTSQASLHLLQDFFLFWTFCTLIIHSQTYLCTN